MSNLKTEGERLSQADINIDTIEKMSHRDRLMGTYDAIRQWINGNQPTSFKNKLKSYLGQKNTSDEANPFIQRPLADLISRFTRLVRLFAPESDRDFTNKMAPVLWKDILDEANQDSVINAGKGKVDVKEEIKNTLKNSISILTLVNLIAVANRSLKENLRLAEIMPEPSKQSLKKVDLIMRFGDVDETGKEIVRFVHLKTSQKAEVAVWQYDPTHGETKDDKSPWEKVVQKRQNMRQAEIIDRLGVNKVDLDKMVKYAQDEIVDQNLTRRFFIVQVPDVYTDVVRNVFGIIQGQGKQRIRDSFKLQALGQGLIPKPIYRKDEKRKHA